jgi:hypothetical protein
MRNLLTFEPDAVRYRLHDLLRAVALESLSWLAGQLAAAERRGDRKAQASVLSRK